MKKIKISTVLFIIGILLISLLIYSNILMPSYASYVAVCNPSLSEKLFPNMVILGKTTSFINESGEREIKVEIIETEDKQESNKILRHELVHVSQAKRGFPSIKCSTPIQKYLAEVEANIFEKLPDKVFYIIYKNIDL